MIRPPDKTRRLCLFGDDDGDDDTVPAEPEPGGDGVITVRLKLPCGTTHTRRFKQTDTARHLVAHAADLLGGPVADVRHFSGLSLLNLPVQLRDLQLDRATVYVFQ
jgi:hypothetical protein